MNINSALITGGLGFLGSYLLEWFEEYSPHTQITIVDNLSSNVIGPEHKLANRHHFIEADMLSLGHASLPDMDVIFHFASPVGPVGILEKAGKIGKIIHSEVEWAIQLALNKNAYLLFMSTSEVYGFRDSPQFLKEDDPKLIAGSYKVRNEYSVGKLLSEITIHTTGLVSSLKFDIIRPFNISGRRQKPDGGFVLPTFVNQAIQNRDLTVFYGGNQVRAFTHAQDIISGVMLVVNSGPSNSVWNIGNPDNTNTILYLAEQVLEAMPFSGSRISNVDPKAIHGPLYEEAWDKIPDISRIRDGLGWKPNWGIRAIIDDVISFYAC